MMCPYAIAKKMYVPPLALIAAGAVAVSSKPAANVST
jgi:hypothetical protein